jgi:hypothetical protein
MRNFTLECFEIFCIKDLTQLRFIVLIILNNLVIDEAVSKLKF